MTEVTQWFKCDKYRPVHAGWYEAMYGSDKRRVVKSYFRYWNGSSWFLDDAHKWSMFGDWGNDDQWRGLCNAQS